MKVNFVRDEWYPYFFILDGHKDLVLNIPEDKIEWVKEGLKRIKEVQYYLYKLDKEQNKK